MSLELYKEKTIERLYELLDIDNNKKYKYKDKDIETGYYNFLYKMNLWEMNLWELEFLEDKLKTLLKDKHQELNLNEDDSKIKQ